MCDFIFKTKILFDLKHQWFSKVLKYFPESFALMLGLNHLRIFISFMLDFFVIIAFIFFLLFTHVSTPGMRSINMKASVCSASYLGIWL